MIDKLREDDYRVEELCEAFEVSRSGYLRGKETPTLRAGKGE